MNNNKYKIDTELLICAIENQRCIWDASCDDYKDRDIKNKGNRDVAAVVVHEFEKYTEREQHEAVMLVQKRWKTARDAYVRDRAKLKKCKSGEAAKKIKKYIYFDNLKFLDKTMDLNITETSLVDDDNEHSAEEKNEDSTILSDEDDEIETPIETRPLQNFARQKRKKKDTLDDKLIAFLNDNANNDQDDHRAFLVSLLPTLKTFTEEQTLRFRSEVLRVVMEIKNIVPHAAPLHPAPFHSGLLPLNIHTGSQQHHLNKTVPQNWPPSGSSSSSHSYYSNQPSRPSPAGSNLFSPTPSETSGLPTLLELSGTHLTDL